jgi:predicted DNA-binding ribbon-helix-helix protein
LQARLARSATISEVFVNAMRAIGQTPDPELARLVDNVKEMLKSGGVKAANTTYNANTRNILNAVRANRNLQANRVYAKFLEKFGNSSKNLASKAILQTLAVNQSLTNNTRTRAQFLLENFNAGIKAARARALRVR